MCEGISNPDNPRFSCDCHLQAICDCDWAEGHSCEFCEEEYYAWLDTTATDFNDPYWDDTYDEYDYDNDIDFSRADEY